jgi:spore maturation protein SpmA
VNVIFLVLVLLAVGTAAVRTMGWSSDDPTPMQLLTDAMVSSSKASVDLAFGLVGMMTLFLGLMKVVEAAGGMQIAARVIRPVLVWLFPDVPKDHPAMGAMVMNLAANALGLGNAATPFGIRAMQELDRLNAEKGTATNAMALFLAINTSSVTLLPTGVIALRAAQGSAHPASIFVPTLIATFCSTTAAVVAVKLMQRLSKPPAALPPDVSEAVPDGDYPLAVSLLVIGALLSLAPAAVLAGPLVTELTAWLLPGLMVGMLVFGAVRKVKIYEVFVEGAKDGLQVAFKIIPYLVAILVAVGMLRASGAIDAFVGLVAPITAPLGMPAEALPMALLRPLSGSGAYGVMAAIMEDPAIGPDSYTGRLVSTIQGSTETTFYVIAVYFGAVGVHRMRHTMWAALIGDVCGVVGAVVAVTLVG